MFNSAQRASEATRSTKSSARTSSHYPSKVQLAYFGKLPSRGDFVRGGHQQPLVQKLDHWLSRTMDLMSRDVSWRSIFDSASPVNFVFLGPQQSMALAGYLMPSQDQSGRRFPFTTTGAFPVYEPARFLCISPLVLGKLWARLTTSAHLAQAAPDLEDAQPQMTAETVQIDTADPGHKTTLEQFMAITTIEQLEQLLRTSEDKTKPASFSLRLAVLALGILLQPTLKHGFTGINKALTLPLPQDPNKRPLVAGFWLTLIQHFLGKNDIELAIFFAPHIQPQRMMVGFNGASTRLLHALLDPKLNAEYEVDITLADWVEEEFKNGPVPSSSFQRLSDYLQDPHMPIKQIEETFCEAFSYL